MNGKQAATVLNGFIHDFATGYWLSCMIVVYYLHEAQRSYPTVAGILTNIEKFFFWNTIAAVIVILATGIGRTFTYVDNIFGERAEQTRRQMLIIKHLLLLVGFGAGGCWAFIASFH